MQLQKGYSIMHNKNRKSFYKGALLGALATLLAVFILGVALVLFAFVGEGQVVNLRTKLKIKVLQELIEQTYLYSDEIDEEILRESLMKGYIDGLGDPYSVYYDKEETKALLESTTGEFGGIGVGISQNQESGLLTLTVVYENSPGEKAGLKSGDIVYKVDGEDVTEMDLDTVVSMIRGEKGTTLEITVLRGETLDEYTCVVTRDIIEVSTVSYEMKEGKIGYIAISGFEKVTYHQFEEALTDLKKQNMKSLIIDLRNNPGGNLSTVCDMLDLILPEGKIVYTEDKNGKQETIKSDAEHQLNIPMVVLINGNSASASEIFAGAVQDYKVATLIGTTTYGKGIVQNVYQLTDGTSLKLTTSEYFTPNGRNIHGIGIEPDVEVEYKYDEENPKADNQLETALDYLKQNKN